MLDAASASARSDLGTGSTSKTSLVSTIRLPEASALSLAQNSHFIFAGLPSGAIRVWKATSLRHHCDLDGHSGSVLALLVVTELRKNWLISASADGTIRVWDSRTLKPLWAIFTPTDGFGDALSLAYFDNRVVFGFQSSAIMWVDLPPIPGNHACDGIRTPPPAGRYNKFFDSQPALDLSRAQASAHGRLYSSLNELTLVSSRSSSGSLSALDTSHNIVEDSANCMTVDVDDVLLSAHYGYIYALAFAYLDGTAVLISGSGDGTIKLWTSSLSKGLTYLHTLLDEQEEAVLALEVRNDTTLYASFQGGKIRVFDLSTFTLIRTLVATKDEDVISLATAGSAMASTSENGVLKVWNPSFLLETSQQAHEGIALCCTASADGQYIYTGGNDGTIKVWYSSQDAIASSLQSAALQGRLFTLLAEFIKYRSVSSDHGCREECRQTAIWLKDALGTLGADATLLSGAPDRNPLVLAKFVKREPQAPYTSTRKRVLFYGHYDVVSEQGSWTSGDPFTLTGIDGCLYGRGVIDNKGPILAVATAAADLLEVNELDIDLVMLLEGEEETDSAGFQDACKRHAAEIGKIDAVLVSNSYSLSEDLPSIMFGLRGRVNLTVSVTSPNPDLHSGQHGGICPEPLIDLTRTLGSLTEPRTGRVSVPGFYDQIRHLDSSEEEAYDEIVRRCSIEMLADFTRHSRFSDPKQALLNSWREPSLSIHRIEVSGSSISTVIPAKAKATVSVRTVPDMPLKSTSAAVVRHLEDVFESGKVTNGGNVLKITIDSAAPWWIADRTHPFSKAAEKAVFEEWNAQPLWIREGGSLPSLPFLEQQFQACVVHLPMGVQGDHAHLTDERTNVTNLQKGYKVVQNWLKAIPTVSEQSNRPVSVAI